MISKAKYTSPESSDSLNFHFIINTKKKKGPLNKFENNGQECIFDTYKFYF